MTSSILNIFEQAYREIRPRSDIPAFKIEFRSYVGVSSTIRLRDGAFLVRISDLLEGAPEVVLRSLAEILLAKIYRKKVPTDVLRRYRTYVSSHHVAQRSNLVRQLRGRKHIHSAQGVIYDLDAIFDDLNHRFFYGLMGRPRLTWSRTRARNRLGHYDPAHNTIVISRLFDSPQVPQYAVDYIVFHEMLHLKHPVRLRGSRRCVHSREFLAEEKEFPHWREAQRFLKHL